MELYLDEVRPEEGGPLMGGAELMLQCIARVAGQNAAPGDLTELFAHLVARSRERFPAEYRDAIVHALIGAAPLICPRDWPGALAQFMDAQVGRDRLGHMLEGHPYAIRDCHEHSLPGYHVVATESVLPRLGSAKEHGPFVASWSHCQ